MIRILARLALAALIAAGPAAAEIAPLTRLSTTDLGRGWEGVGRLDVGGQAFCTGALVREDLVLTAAHCLHDPSGAPVDPATITFLAGWRDGRAAAYRGVRHAVWSEGFVSGAAPLDSVPSDIAIVQLDRPIRDGRTHPFAIGALPQGGGALGVVSYAAGRSEAPSLQRTCDALGRSGGMLVTSCEAEFGASGAPIFDLSGAEARIVSVIAAKARSRGRRVALGAEVAPVVHDLIARIDARPERMDAAGGAKFVRP